MSTLITPLLQLRDDEQGVTSIEYGLIAAVVSVGIIGAISAFTGSLNNLWGMITDTVLAAI
ncbi:MAG: Flp family type IVb pilin [Deltaproteobacteria bacterium]|jgi:pilus assembly protein Flp/PilA|nr:Flp family type IVb pilin [Deltaproteobacteria bacterium]MBK9364856.1 Flp family type IVb pilin [Deltaproteobacteria bacterium]MBK9647338.1 Flp family type IVb pilin [Deltaproteobacteria bacterium]